MGGCALERGEGAVLLERLCQRFHAREVDHQVVIIIEVATQMVVGQPVRGKVRVVGVSGC